MIGDNQANAEFRRRAEEMSRVLDEIAELHDRIKELRAAAKSDGYDLKAFAQVVKEMRRGAEYQADQLQLELVLDTYRRAVDLPVDLEVAQQRAAAAAEALPGSPDDEDDDTPDTGEDGAPARRPRRRRRSRREMMN